MILDIVDRLNKLKIILASGSPRRRELLGQTGLVFSVRVSNFEENLEKESFADATAYNLATAHGKMNDILSVLDGSADMVVACDTIVVPCDDPKKIIEKASTKDEAADMIRGLRGKSHYVYSALLVHFTKLGRTFDAVVRTEVKMAHVADSVVDAYVQNESAWRGKSGAYGIQDVAASFIEGVVGDYYNVMGFPLCTFCSLVRKIAEEYPEILAEGASTA